MKLGMTILKGNAREVALDALIKLDQNQAYSNLLLQSAMKANDLSDKDRGLLTELFTAPFRISWRLIIC